MADKTRDIWNDDDGEEDRPAPRHRLRAFLVFFLTLMVTLGLVMVAAWRDGTGFDALRRYFTYGGEQAASLEYRYDASGNNRFAAVGDSLAVLSPTTVRLLDKNGTETWSASMAGTAAPALQAAGDRAVAYGAGGLTLYVVDGSGELLHLTADPAEPIIAARLNESGYLAVTAQKRGAKGCVSVYNAQMKLVFQFTASERFVTDACVTEDGAYLAAVTLGQENSVFVSSILLYDLSQTDPVASYQVTDGLVLDIGEVGETLRTISDTALTFGDRTGKVTATYGYGGSFLREYDIGGEDFTVLLLGRYRSGSVGRLVCVDSGGTELGTLEVNEEIRAVSAAGRYIAVLYADRLEVYNPELLTYASTEDVDNVQDILMGENGSVLLLGAESARRFLP